MSPLLYNIAAATALTSRHRKMRRIKSAPLPLPERSPTLTPMDMRSSLSTAAVSVFRSREL